MRPHQEPDLVSRLTQPGYRNCLSFHLQHAQNCGVAFVADEFEVVGIEYSVDQASGQDLELKPVQCFPSIGETDFSVAGRGPGQGPVKKDS
jgi:hypothetical protein